MTGKTARRAAKVPLRCRCGRVRGAANGVSPAAGLRFVCYCKDCQAFTRFLGRPDVLDQAGGTDIFQMPIGRISIDAGADAISCVRLAGQGVYRWYAACCQTPIGNTMGPGVPMIGLIHSFMDHQADGRPRDLVLGPPLCRIFEGSATGPLPSAAPPPPTSAVFFRRLSKLFVWWARGLARPNPFFDLRTGAPCAVPRVLGPDERATLEGAVVGGG